ncbi:Mov34/MPN/PAD-1 family protein [Actinacidiphila acidipaludis]|uniref:Mov34/MPN/PAD-1 family protein n=1 Tax=Actinacidiphila acidipaludis TaxID=2873382 RepID=A0ABS7QHS9_9ACTN|nr:Mov34/MPN/PAD-1 family protein [Streptomyces acidipaludis]MBY8882718.1 Mov34/MPN/PAD-1 family protein [Streptomyces acidipaludis]
MITSQEMLILPTGALDPVVAAVEEHGLADRETGALLLTKRSAPGVTVVAVTGQVGIERSSRRFVVSAAAYDRLFTYAEQRSYQVRAMIHSHPREAFLSQTDRMYSLQVPGFVSAVIPNYASPPADPASWGWWRFEGDWQLCPVPFVGAGLPSARTVVFDAEGVDEY